MDILRAARAMVSRWKPRVYASQGVSGGWGGRWWLPAAKFDYQTEAGKVYDSSAVGIALNWLMRTWPEARWVVQREQSDGTFKVEPRHDALKVLRRPNGWYDGTSMQTALVLSLCVDGNAYALKLRDRAGRVLGLFYVAHWQMRPMSDRDNEGGHKLITYYEYTPIGGTPEPVPIEDVVHLRWGLDPMDTRRGLSPLGAQLREVCSDNEASTYAAALLRNMGVPSAMLSPKPAQPGMPPAQQTPEQQEKFRKQWRERFQGEGVGSPMVAPWPLDVHQLGMTPEQMALDKVRRIPADRVTAALGLNSMVLGLPSESKTYSNYAESREAAYEDCVIPLRRLFAEQATQQILDRDWPGDGLEFASDYSEVRVLQADQDKLYGRVGKVFQVGLIDRATGKGLLKLPFDAADEGVYATDFAGRTVADRAEDEKQAAKAAVVAQLIELGVSAEAAARAVGFDADLAGALARRDWVE